MAKLRIYLDTSVISALFDIRNPERKSLTEAFFEKMDEFSVSISDLTVSEIEKTPDTELKLKMRGSITTLPIISISDQIEWLAQEYIRYDAIPRDEQEDAFHIAIAVLNGMDYLLSWNFKHIIRRKTKDIVRMVNTIHRQRQIEICAPAELL